MPLQYLVGMRVLDGEPRGMDGGTKSLALTGDTRARVPPHSAPLSRSASGSLGKKGRTRGG